MMPGTKTIGIIRDNRYTRRKYPKVDKSHIKTGSKIAKRTIKRMKLINSFLAAVFLYLIINQ